MDGGARRLCRLARWRLPAGRAILRYDLASGTVLRRYELPAPSPAAPGDIAIAANHDVVAGDGRTGAVYVIRAAGDSLETLVPPGRIPASQQPAFASDGRSFFIPSYGRGIARVNRADGALTWLSHPDSVTLSGIDGLILRGRDLIAVQNGVTPQRIVWLVLDRAQTTVVRAEILLRDTVLAPELTHVAWLNGSLYAIGNAGWNKYGDDGAPVPGASREPPRIIRLDVR